MTSRTSHPYTVLGAGAIGGTLAVALLEAGRAVQVVDADPQHVAAIRHRGLQIRSAAEVRTAWVPAFGLDDAPPVLGPVLLAVKGQATAAACAWLTARLADDGWVASMQNGLNEPAIAQAVGEHRTVAAFVDLFADVVEPGVVLDGGAGALAMGEYRGRADSERVMRLAEDLSRVAAARVTDNVEGFLWAKLAFGSMSSVTALGTSTMYELVDVHRATMRGLASEVSGVGIAAGVRLEDFDAYRAAAFSPGAAPSDTEAAIDALVAWLTTQPKTRSGIWRDIAVRHRPTEVASHYFPVLALARRLDRSVPLLQELLRSIARLERGQEVQDDAHLDRFDAAARELGS